MCNVFCRNVIFIGMGRKKLNRSKEELDAMNLVRVKKHRSLNREKINARRMELYYVKKANTGRVCK